MSGIKVEAARSLLKRAHEILKKSDTHNLQKAADYLNDVIKLIGRSTG